jgi:heme-degrading monooxygenase HmoA
VTEEGRRIAIKSIVEMKAKPRRRDELLNMLQQMSAVDAPGFIAAQHFRNVEDEDRHRNLNDWKSNEERAAWSQSVDPGTREQLIGLLATPMRIVLADPIIE